MKQRVFYALASSLMITPLLWAAPEKEERLRHYRQYKKTDENTIEKMREFRIQYKNSKKILQKNEPKKETVLIKLPTKIDLRQFSDIYDQGPLGSCTANALCGAVKSQEKQKAGKNANQVVSGSRLWLYYEERKSEGNTKEDTGAMIGTGVMILHTQGLPDESTWSYDVKKFTQTPPKESYTSAKKRKEIDPQFKANDYIDSSKSDVIDRIKTALSKKYRVVTGFAVYESFEGGSVAKTGFVPMPDTQNEELLGGHAVCVVGYDDNLISLDKKHKGHFIIANSWGKNWGKGGFFYMPYAFMKDPNLNWEAWKIDDVVSLKTSKIDLHPTNDNKLSLPSTNTNKVVTIVEKKTEKKEEKKKENK